MWHAILLIHPDKLVALGDNVLFELFSLLDGYMSKYCHP